MSEHPAGLWPAPGDGVLARRGNLVVLTSAESADMVDLLLDILEQLAAAGGDGRRFADAVAAAIEADPGGLAGDGGPSVLAFGPAGQGMAVTVCGAAWAEVSTAHGSARLEAIRPGMLLRCLLVTPVSGVLGGLGLGGEVAARTDRFSRLDAGTVRASGLGYYLAGPPPGRDAPGAAAIPVQASPAEPVPADAGPPEPVMPEPVMPEPAIPEPAMMEPEPPVAAFLEPEPGDFEPIPPLAGPSVPAGSPGPADAPMPTELWSIPVPDQWPGDLAPAAAGGPVGADHEATIAPVAEPFDAVMLVGAGPAEELGLLPRDPLPKASDMPPGTSSYASEAPIIEGVYCKNGHFDDPEALFCAICGISMNQQTLVPRPGARPPLGVLILDDGSVFQLDSDYIVGREPGLDASVASGRSRPLRVADDSGIVSRVHARVSLDGWRVTVTDLGSANGTQVKLPHDAGDQALVPHVPVVVATGSRVDLGGREFRYESHRGR